MVQVETVRITKIMKHVKQLLHYLTGEPAMGRQISTQAGPIVSPPCHGEAGGRGSRQSEASVESGQRRREGGRERCLHLASSSQ